MPSITHKVIFLLLAVSFVECAFGRTLSWDVVPFETAVSRAKTVATVRIVEAKLLQLPEPAAKRLHIHDCGINVKAEVVSAYKNAVAKTVEFSTDAYPKVGGIHFAMLSESNPVRWYMDSNWSSFMTGRKIELAELACLSQRHRLFADSFPQQFFEIDYDEQLIVQATDIDFPVGWQVKSSEWLETVEFMERRVKFGELESYLSHRAKEKR